MSNVPPPFTPMAPKKSMSPLVIILIVMVGLCVVCGVGAAGFAWWGIKKVSPIAGCMMNFTAAQRGMMDYVRANGNKFPQAETWQDDIKTYVAKYLGSDETGPFSAMDPNGEWFCEGESGGKTGLAFNTELAGKNLTDVKDPYTTVMIFEIETPSRNAHEAFKRREEKTSPTMFGEHRGWIAVTVQGEVTGMNNKSGSTKFNIDTKSSSGSDSNSEDN